MTSVPTTYDTIVVGAGPCGLTLATKLPGTTLLLDQRDNVGGCHAVHRDDGLFCEHGPRYLNGCYVNARDVLASVGIRWDEAFERRPFHPDVVDGRGWWRHFSPYETLVFSVLFCCLIVVPHFGRSTSLADVCRTFGFSSGTRDYIEHVCRTTDGCGADRYSLHKFLRGFNDHVHSFYQPRRANDRGLFARWTSALVRRGVRVETGARAVRVLHRDGRAVGLVYRTKDGDRVARARRVVLAIPPDPLVHLIESSGLHEPGLAALADDTEYDEYYCAAFHFSKTTEPLVDHRGVRTTPWGLIYADMGHMRDEGTSVVMVAAWRLDSRSPVTGKTINQSSRDEVHRELLRQLPISEATKRTLVRVVSTDMRLEGGSWHNRSEAYVHNATGGDGFGPAMRCCRGLYSVGTHNERSWYPFTSFESAVCNALAFAGAPCRRPWTPIRLARLLLLCALVYVAVARYV